MDLEPSDEQRLITETVRKFVRNEIAPLDTVYCANSDAAAWRSCIWPNAPTASTNKRSR